MFVSPALLLLLWAAPVLHADADRNADALFRAGRYAEAAEAFARMRQSHPTDDTLVLKQFLACEYAAVGCAHDARLDAYYAEKNGSPFASLMLDYLRDRITLMEGYRIRTPLSGWRWKAFNAGAPLSEAEFYMLAGEPGLSEKAARRKRNAWALGASGSTLAFAAAGLLATRPGPCGHGKSPEDCQALEAGAVVIGIGGLGAAFAGMAMGAQNLIPLDEARAFANRYNISILRKRVEDRDPFGERRRPEPDSGTGG